MSLIGREIQECAGKCFIIEKGRSIAKLFKVRGSKGDGS